MKQLATLLAPLLLCGCVGFIKTNEVADTAAIAVPQERLLTHQAPEAGLAKFSITRDTGMLGGGCNIGVEISRKLAARFSTGETATFYVKPGPVELSVIADPMGKGLCGVFGFEPVREIYEIAASRAPRFRLSLRQYRRPELELYEDEPVGTDAPPTTPVAIATPVVSPQTVASPSPASAAGTHPSRPEDSRASLAAMQGNAESNSSASTPVEGSASRLSNALVSQPKEFRYQVSAESLAKSRQCTVLPAARFLASGPGSETYSIPCDSGDALLVSCYFGHCRAREP